MDKGSREISDKDAMAEHTTRLIVTVCSGLILGKDVFIVFVVDCCCLSSLTLESLRVTLVVIKLFLLVKYKNTDNFTDGKLNITYLYLKDTLIQQSNDIDIQP